MSLVQNPKGRKLNHCFPALASGPPAVTNPALAPPLTIERYRALEPHLTDGVTLAELARAGGASERTLQRWLRRYRVEGLSGLGRSPRSDRGNPQYWAKACSRALNRTFRVAAS